MAVAGRFRPLPRRADRASGPDCDADPRHAPDAHRPVRVLPVQAAPVTIRRKNRARTPRCRANGPGIHAMAMRRARTSATTSDWLTAFCFYTIIQHLKTVIKMLIACSIEGNVLTVKKGTDQHSSDSNQYTAPRHRAPALPVAANRADRNRGYGYQPRAAPRWLAEFIVHALGPAVSVVGRTGVCPGWRRTGTAVVWRPRDGALARLQREPDPAAPRPPDIPVPCHHAEITGPARPGEK
jgi:hypothetical protein